MQNELYIVADAIKALRESRGLTQEQLAEKADISVSHLAKIETHARAMGMKTYIRLLEAMDRSVGICLQGGFYMPGKAETGEKTVRFASKKC